MRTLQRRHFLKTIGVAGAALLAGIPAWALRENGFQSLVILHTNDTHSRLEPYPASDPNFPNQGGYARRAAIIHRERKKNPDLLLLDAGDIFQGTPYFNLYGGEPELKLMSKMGYDASAFGNHEFDNGMDGFDNVLPFANFPFLAANYDFSQTILADKVKPYQIIRRQGINIGIYGLGINPEGLVSRSLYGDTRYLDPIETARVSEVTLKQKYNCQLIVCLSHLGLRYQDKRVSDMMIAGHTRHTHIIIGGHTHQLLDPAIITTNERKENVCIGQAGYGGAFLGRMNVIFKPGEEGLFIESNTTKI